MAPHYSGHELKILLIFTTFWTRQGPLYTILYNDVVPTLEHLQSAGFKLAIFSNWDTPLGPLTERLGIAKYFDAIIASHDARVRSEKPDLHIFNYALTAVGVSAEQAVHVGDNYEADIVGAQGVGIRPILLDRERQMGGNDSESR